MVATTQLFPAGHYKNVYIFTNNEFSFKIIIYVANFSKDKVEF